MSSIAARTYDAELSLNQIYRFVDLEMDNALQTTRNV